MLYKLYSWAQHLKFCHFYGNYSKYRHLMRNIPGLSMFYLQSSTSFIASLVEEPALNFSHASYIVMSATALIVLTNLLISKLFAATVFGSFKNDVKVSSPEYLCPMALILYAAFVFMLCYHTTLRCKNQ